MDFMSSQFWLSVLQIVWIDLLLSGDNAVVIALACRSLPEKQRKIGIWLGAGAAIFLRIVFALVVSYLMGLPFLKVLGGLLLFWIAIKLVVGEEEAHDGIESSDSLWRAVKTIAIADAVMSLDNVIAIAAASRGHPELFIFGLLLSIPLIIYGSQIIMDLLTWVVDVPVSVNPQGMGPSALPHYGAAAIGAAVVIIAGYLIRGRRAAA
jgi:YjbE family integral membrane protein